MTSLRAWARDLAMGARFAVTGGRAGLLRTALTAVGTGIGVALLLFLTALPQALDARNTRAMERGIGFRTADRPGAATLLAQEADTVYRDRTVHGRLLRPEGPRAPRPPGVAALPAPGEMVVSPALRDLLASDRGALLRERLPHHVTGTIGDRGLMGPDELLYYAGDDRLVVRTLPANGPRRITAFGRDYGEPQPDAAVALMAGLASAALLLPVCALVATAVRFGGERRDRRLAALRLVGADHRTTRRVAAGEAMAASLAGLAIGAGLFLCARPFAPRLSLRGVGLFPADLTPGTAALVVILLGVPLTAVVISLFALRHVAIEPLGVVREATRRRRRLWWRLLLPAAGLAMLVPYVLRRPPSTGIVLGQPSLWAALSAGLLLLGVVTLLPWLVEAVVGRLRGGPPSWQLATRRLQLDSGPASRAVTGITIAVAGAIAVQMLLAGTTTATPYRGADRDVMRVVLPLGGKDDAQAIAERFGRAPGVRSAAGFVSTHAHTAGGNDVVPLHVADCATLRRMAGLESCEDGDVFVAAGDSPRRPSEVRPGEALALEREGKAPERWNVPASAPVVMPRQAPEFLPADLGVLATPSALDVRGLPDATAGVLIRLGSPSPDAVEHVRNTAAALAPAAEVDFTEWVAEPDHDTEYAVMLSALPWAAAVTLGLVGTSLMLATLEQLRERRRPVATLAAFGTSRSTVAWSLVWQTVIPVVLGMLLAVAGGLALGRVMLSVVDAPVRDRFAFLQVVGLGAGVIALVTLAALPPLWRMMRPDGLRAE
ncbi:FtsX-like permease family protein [Streptomyces sp. NPDC053048]|uniref:FtsX-like permease family protein n=1 Tax=Streptomyces sp. NPDC053048 TaxID=3365694 RepID=UPI0037D7989A